MKKIGFWVAMLCVVALVGCASTAKKEPPPVEDLSGADTRGATDKGVSEAEALAARQADLLAKTRVHFAFDSSTIDDEARAIIEAHAAHLAANPQIRLVLEGHCDERGTREYNLALGGRRANAAKDYLVSLGVDGGRLNTVSYGKERPVCLESNENCWAQNRRAVTVIASGAAS